MAFEHGRKARVYIAGRNMSDYLSSASLNTEVDTAEVSTFGVDSKQYIPGLKDGTLSLEGNYDSGANKIAELLNSLRQVTPVLLSYLPQGDTLGAVAYSMNAIETSFEIGTEISDAGKISMEANSSGDMDLLLSHHPLAQEVASGNGAAVDGLAASINGGAGYIHVPDITGISNLAITIQDSADGSTGWANIVTFAGVTADFSRERVQISGTVRRYTRAAWTFTGTGSATFFAGFGRF